MYKPEIGQQVIVDYKVLKKPVDKRTGVIINKVQRREDKSQYTDVYLIRTGHGDIVHAKLGQFTKLKRRHIDGVQSHG